jgi:7,8-dihydropterin-6-yl-methyl-4-(beta-D-ribofuranosyl)aminobenzene 5'-phosphate synthase
MNATAFESFKVAEIEGLQVLSLVDNSADFVSTPSRAEVQSFRQWTNKRYGQEWAKDHSELPVAEHGFSMFIRILQGGKSSSILFDTGVSSEGVTINAERMGIDLSEVECVVLSHGHYDHAGGLLSALEAINNVNLPLIVHEDMFKKRGTITPDGKIRVHQEFPTKQQLTQAELIVTKKPLLIANGKILITGEIPRETDFEKGFLNHKALINGTWQPDPLIWDDRAVIVNVKGKGLVILSGCAHSGIINTVSYAQKITGIKNIYAIIGGFHLAGKNFENRIEQTIKELKKISPKIIVPTHCTGWRAIIAIADAMPEAFVWNSVGNLYSL